MTTGIVVALPEELGTLTKKKIGMHHCAMIRNNLIVAHAGCGPKNAEDATQRLINAGATSLISWGCCAALDTELRPGDLALPETLVSSATHKNIMSDTSWHEHTFGILSKNFRIITDKLLESSEIVAKGREKNRLFAETGCACLDMESTAVARIATKNDLPFLAIRSVADPADMDLPEAVQQSMDEHGRINLKKLLAFLLTHVYEIPGLIRLGLHFRAAGNQLRIVAKLMDSIIAPVQPSSVSIRH